MGDNSKPQSNPIPAGTRLQVRPKSEELGWWARIQAQIKQFTASKKGAQDALKRVTGSDNRVTVNLAEQGRLYDPFAWVRHVLLWTNWQVIILAVACVIATALSYAITHRGLMVIDLPESLRSQVYTQYATTDPDRDEFDRFVLSTLGTLHQFDYKSSPNIEILKGLVNPDIYMKVQQSYQASSEQIHTKGIIQELHISKIDNVYPSVNGKRYSATVKGYLNVSSTINDRKTQKFLPYRARVVVRLQPPSILNKSGYYLTQLSEFAGDEPARKFDAEIKADLEKRGLR